MNPFNSPVISAVANSGTVTSDPIDSSFMLMLTAQASFTDGAAAGTLKLQASNDPKSPTKWNDIPNATASAASGATTMTPILPTWFCYKWVRVVFTSSGGAGTLTVSAHGMGA